MIFTRMFIGITAEYFYNSILFFTEDSLAVIQFKLWKSHTNVEN